MGRVILEAATEQRKQRFSAPVIRKITAIQDRIPLLEQEITEANKGLNIAYSVLEAFEEGKFSIDSSGNVHFNEKHLNTAWEGY